MNNLRDIAHHISNTLRYSTGLIPDDTGVNADDLRIICRDNGVYIVLAMPSVLDLTDINSVTDKIFALVSLAVFPRYTCLRTLTPQIVPVNSGNLRNSRAIFIPWKKGRFDRIRSSMGQLLSWRTGNKIPLQLSNDGNGHIIPECFDYNKNIAIEGQTRSGKSQFMTYLMAYDASGAINNGNVKIIAIDPKVSSLARFGRNHSNIKVILPDTDSGESIGNSYLEKVNSVLDKLVSICRKRQAYLYNHAVQINIDYRICGMCPIIVFIDEVAALNISSSRKFKLEFINALSNLCILGSESGVFIVIAAQQLSVGNSGISSLIISQMSIRVHLGLVTPRATQYLFPSISSVSGFIPTEPYSGIISIRDSSPLHDGSVEPFYAPTIQKG